MLITVCQVLAQSGFLTCNLLFIVGNLPFGRVRESQMATSFLYKVKKIIPFPIFAVLLVSSIGAYKMASNKKGGMLTYKNIINVQYYLQFLIKPHIFRILSTSIH